MTLWGQGVKTGFGDGHFTSRVATVWLGRALQPGMGSTSAESEAASPSLQGHLVWRPG